MKTTESAARVRRGRWVSPVVVSAACLAALAGCAQNPFATSESDLGRRVSIARLREVQPMDVSEYATVVSRDPEPSDVRIDPFEGMESVDLALETVRAAVLSNNLDLRVTLYDPTISQQTLEAEEAAFDAAFTLNANWNEIDNVVTNSTQDGQARVQQVTPGVRIPLRTGGTALVELPMSRTKTDNAFATENPSYSSDVRFSITQELLRGAGRRVNTAPIRIASYENQATQARTKLEVIRAVADADRAYWGLYGAKKQLEVRQQQYELAVSQLERARRLFDAGNTPEVEVIRAEAGVANRLDGIIRTENEVLRQQRSLKRLINIPGLDIDTPQLIEPTSPPDPVEYEYNTDALQELALAQRMEMLELELQIARESVMLDLRRNEALPRVALDYSYAFQGQGGTLSNSYDVLGENRFATWTLGLRAEMSLTNDQAEALVRRAILERLQRLGSRDAVGLQIRQEVLDSVEALQAAWQRIAASRQSVILNTRSYEAEKRQFDVGRSTSTDVLNAAAELADAQSIEVDAVVEYQIAQIDLAYATGTLLGAAKVEWSPIDPDLHDEDGPALPWGLSEPTPIGPLADEPAQEPAGKKADHEKADQPSAGVGS